MDLKELKKISRLSKDSILEDFRICILSREASLVGRKEVLSGRAKFGIFGDGKEVAQVALARSMKPGDWRSGYYRDQTIMLALGLITIESFFAQLYADADIKRDPSSGGRQMNSHFCTRTLDEKGGWKNLLPTVQSAADLSPTAGQMTRIAGLGYASKLYRENPKLSGLTKFSSQGSEIAYSTIGDASTSEGLFWETLNAVGVLQVPVIMTVWDDGFGISVPKKYQTTKESISDVCQGFEPSLDGKLSGIKVRKVSGWNYPELMTAYRTASEECRKNHQPFLIHVAELTQPQGHSTSGSHERYKSPERLQFESEFDALERFRQWILNENIASQSELADLEEKARISVHHAKEQAWNAMLQPVLDARASLKLVLSSWQSSQPENEMLKNGLTFLSSSQSMSRRSLASIAQKIWVESAGINSGSREGLQKWMLDFELQNRKTYNTFLYNESDTSALKVASVAPTVTDRSEVLDGSQVIRKCFDALLERDPRVFIIGEDVGHLGGVNTEFDGLQEKYGKLRVTDTGIREASILGQGIGAALRGLRPLVDIQYLDYVLYCLQGMSDDLASLHYRTAGGQIAPVIVRTKGHRLEGIWHTGSPMGMILHAIRGMHFCVPRNMVQAAGMYNTLFQSDDPAFVCEVLNGYRLKEKCPTNLSEFRLELGVPEILRSGHHLTLVTYGACVRIAEEACTLLSKVGIEVELIDVQTLLPFDKNGVIAQSISKTHAVLFLDEDVSGGATGYMMAKVLDEMGAFAFLDSAPRCLTAQDHRGSYGSDGDYYSKPNVEDVFKNVCEILNRNVR